MMEFNIITVLSIIILILSLIKFWKLSKGNLKLTYQLDLIVFPCYIILETIVALNHSSQSSLLFMNVINVWAIVMAIKGLIRVSKESGV